MQTGWNILDKMSAIGAPLQTFARKAADLTYQIRTGVQRIIVAGLSAEWPGFSQI